MKAIRFHKYGPPNVLRLEDTKRPKPRRGQVLVKLVATSVNPKDCLVRKGKLRLVSGWRFPKSLGNDLAGEIVELGPGAREFELGKRVFGMINAIAGKTYAEYVAVSTREITLAPDAIELTDAAGMPLVCLTSLQALRDIGGITATSQVCINGASGGVGTVAIQIAKAYGAHVTAVCSKRNQELCERLGADEVVPYDERAVLDGERSFDIFFDIFGNYSFEATKAALRDRGCFVSATPSRNTVLSVLKTVRSKKRARIVMVKSKQSDLDVLAKLIRQRKLTPVTDKVFPLEEAVAAHEYIQTKRARGKVVLEIT